MSEPTSRCLGLLPDTRLRVLRVAAASVAIVATASACSSDEADSGGGQAAVSVVASTNVYAAIANAVGGDLVEAQAFIASAQQDPHSYEASTRDILAINDADLVIENGGGYDDFMQQLLDSASSEPPVIDAVDAAGLGSSDGDDFNEHVWYDLPAMQQVADRIAAELGVIDPDHAADYRAGAKAFRSEVGALVDRTDALSSELSGAGVAVTEPVPGYLLEAMGLDDLTPSAFSEAVEEGEDVSVAVLDETLSLFSDHEVELLVYNEQTSGTITDRVLDAAQDAGVPEVGMTETLPDSDDYVSWMRSNILEIEQALR